MTPNEIALFNKVIDRVNDLSTIALLGIVLSVIGLGALIMFACTVNKRLDDLEAKQR
jgi:hypothetical protein